MGDLKLSWLSGAADLTILDDDVEPDEGLRTAVLLSLFTDRRADEGDTLPDESGDVRGWWGDQFLANSEDRTGSKLWLLSRSKVSELLAPQVARYDREALQWMIDDCVAAAIDVEVVIDGDRLFHTVTVHKPEGGAACFRFGHAWDAEENPGAADAPPVPFVWSGAFPFPATSSADLMIYLGLDGVIPEASHLWQMDRVNPIDTGSLATANFNFNSSVDCSVTQDANYGQGILDIVDKDLAVLGGMASSPGGFPVPSVMDGTKSFLVGGIAQIDTLIGAQAWQNIVSKFNASGRGWALFALKVDPVTLIRFNVVESNFGVISAADATPDVPLELGQPFAFLCGINNGQIFNMISKAGSFVANAWAPTANFDPSTDPFRFGRSTWFGVTDSYSGLCAQIFTLEWPAATDAGIGESTMDSFLQYCDGYLTP